MDYEILIVLVIIFVLQAIILFVVLKKIRKDREQGYPFQDEMSTQLLFKSGAYSFWLSWLLWLVIFFFSSLSGEIKPNWDIYFGLLGMGVIFITTILIVKKKGVL
jgi:magnesium-transporting ATPase (P-type)